MEGSREYDRVTYVLSPARSAASMVVRLIVVDYQELINEWVHSNLRGSDDIKGFTLWVVLEDPFGVRR